MKTRAEAGPGKTHARQLPGPGPGAVDQVDGRFNQDPPWRPLATRVVCWQCWLE